MKDPIDVIGEGGAVITRDDLLTLGSILRRLREHIRAFPWSVEQVVDVATTLKVAANDLDDLLTRAEGQ